MCLCVHTVGFVSLTQIQTQIHKAPPNQAITAQVAEALPGLEVVLAFTFLAEGGPIPFPTVAPEISKPHARKSRPRTKSQRKSWMASPARLPGI